MVDQLSPDGGYLLRARNVMDDQAAGGVELGVHGVGVVVGRTRRDAE
ncbi:hypothetical protein [Candidatus Poriferisodalis sp.]